jgi:hypothetical protein
MLSPTGKALTTRTAVRTAFLNCTTETRYNYQSEQYYRIKRKGEVQLHYHSTFDDDVPLYPNPEFERKECTLLSTIYNRERVGTSGWHWGR